MIENINLKLKETENQLIYYAKKISILRKNKALELEREVKYILNQINKVEQGIKMGKIDTSISIDYLLLNIL